MNILELNSSDKWCGVDVHFINLCKGLTKYGNKVIAVCKKNSDLSKRITKEDINFELLPLRNSADIYSAFKISKIIKENKIEIIHTHTARDYLLSIIAGKFLNKVKVVCTRHNTFPLNNLFHKIQARYIDVFISVSDAVKKVLTEIDKFDSNRVFTIYNSIDVDNFVRISSLDYNQSISISIREELNLSKDTYIFAYIGRITYPKGIEDFILSANIFLKSLSDIQKQKLRFLIIGSAENNNYENKIKEMIQNNQYIIWIGFREDIAKVMNEIDVFVLPSKSIWSDPCPTVILEAMALSKPIIATNTGGVPELIEDNITGKLIPPDNPEILANTMLYFYNNPDFTNYLSLNCYKRVKKLFDIEIMVKNIINLFNNLLKM